MKRLSTRKILICIVLSFLLLIISCNTENNIEKGTINISIDDTIGRIIDSSISLDVSKYTLVFKGPNNLSFSTTLSPDSSTHTKMDVEVGEWNITAVAYNSNNITIGEGCTSVNVTAGNTSTASITVYEYEGTGTFTVTLTDAQSDYSVVILKVTNGVCSEVERKSLERDENSNLSASFTLRNGFYQINLESSNDAVALPAPEAFRMIKGDSIGVNYTIHDIGGIQTVISNGILQSPIMKLSLNKEPVEVNAEVIVNASVSSGTYKYYWYIDGIKQNESANTISLSFNNEGVHTIDCLAIDTTTGVILSSKIILDVEAGEEEVLIPVLINETQGSARYLDTTFNSNESQYYMFAPVIKGFEKRNHSFKNGNLEIETTFLGKKLTKTVSKDKSSGNYIYSVHDEDNQGLDFTMEYNKKEKSFSYKQAFLYSTNSKLGESIITEYVMIISEGNDIKVTPEGNYSGITHVIGIQSMGESPTASPLVESNDIYIYSNKDHSLALCNGLLSGYIIEKGYADNKDIWLRTDVNVTFDDIYSRLLLAKEKGQLMGELPSVDLRIYNKNSNAFEVFNGNQENIKNKLKELGLESLLETQTE